ncbi:hypothetical protein BN128_1822 [Cronobacter sakazakii 696]|nr:hypothetical protein BN128_1822 [Cronobacter sakazakii 696]
MIGARRGGADKPDVFACQQIAIDLRDRAHHQCVGIVQRRLRDRAARHGLHLAKTAEQLACVRHIFINEDFHVSLPVYVREIAVKCAIISPPGILNSVVSFAAPSGQVKDY